MTLTEVSYYSRRMMPFVIIFLLVVLILFYAFKLMFLYMNINQPKSVYTNPVFGKIKRPLLKEASSTAGLNFILDTIEGQPVTSTDSADVYFLPPKQTRFNYLQQVSAMAKTAGFDIDVVKPQSLGENEVLFDDAKQKLKINTANFNFNYEYQLDALNRDFFSTESATILPAQEDIENKAVDFLKSLDRYPEEISQGKRNLIYWRYIPVNKQLTIVDSAQEANMVEVDFYRVGIGDFPIVSSTFSNSPNYVFLSFNNDVSQVIKAQILFYEKSTDQKGIYPVKTGSVAWEELKTGKGMVVSGDRSIKDFNIKKMFIGYLDPETYQEYFQPVYVFLGDNNFVAYVFAIDDNYYSD